MLSAFAVRYLRQSNHIKNKEKNISPRIAKNTDQTKPPPTCNTYPWVCCAAVLIMLRKWRVKCSSKKKKSSAHILRLTSQISSTIHINSSDFPGDETWVCAPAHFVRGGWFGHLKQRCLWKTSPGWWAMASLTPWLLSLSYSPCLEAAESTKEQKRCM